MPTIIKVISGFIEDEQRKIMSVLLCGTSKAKTALQFETSRGTIIRIEKQMQPIIDDEIELEIHKSEMIGNDDSIQDDWDGEDGPYYGLNKIKRTPFMFMMFNY
jgi:hypothetical protein